MTFPQGTIETSMQSMSSRRGTSRASSVGNPFARQSLALFLIGQFISLSRDAGISHFGPSYNIIGLAGSVLSLACVVGAGLAYSGGKLGILAKAFRLWFILLLACMTGFFCYGWLIRGAPLRHAIQDIGTFTILASFVVMGASKDFWIDAPKILMRISFAGVVLCVMVLLFQENIGSLGWLSGRIARDLIVYETAGVLELVPLLLFLSPGMNPLGRIGIITAFGFQVCLEVVFQKRLNFIVLTAFWGLFMVLTYPRKSQARVLSKAEWRKLLFVSMAMGLLAGMFMTQSEAFRTQAQGLLGRFGGLFDSSSGGSNYASAFARNERWTLVAEILREFSTADWILGKGFGGAVEYMDERMEQQLRAGEFDAIDQWYIGEDGYYGRRSLEVGWGMILIKGGLTLLLVLGIGFLGACIRGFRQAGIGYFSRVCCALVGIHLLNLSVGSVFGLDASYQLVVFGSCLGYCMRRPDATREWGVFESTHSNGNSGSQRAAPPLWRRNWTGSHERDIPGRGK